MNFDLYNLLSTLIPGIILYAVGSYALGFDIKSIPEIPALSVAYVLGYFINAIGGWLEKFIFWTWGGEPGLQLLKGKGCGRIGFNEKERLSCLKDEDNVSDKKLFRIAMRLSNGDKRVSGMNASYAFSRSILVLLSVIYIFFLPIYLKSATFHLFAIPVIFLAWYRSKERAFYYAKEVLVSAINKRYKPRQD